MEYKDTKRYTVPTDEDFEPGSNNEVLKNFKGIKSKAKIEDIEGNELRRVENELIKIYDQDHSFTANDICKIHKMWLGKVYPSAGKYRTVTMSKGGFPFAAPGRIDQCMQKLEKDFLSKYTPCHYDDIDELASAIGIVHVELIVIHPFREGNGRTARLLADLMAMQANRSPLDYQAIDQIKNENGFKEYILAIHVGVNGSYEPITKIFKKLLEVSN